MFRYIYSGIQKLIEFGLKFDQSNNAVLVFHQINDDKNTWDYPNCSITTKSFNSLLLRLINDNYSFDIIENCLSQKVTNNNYVYLSFDDAYADVYNICFPLLLKYNIPFTIFMTVDYLNKKKYLTIDMIKEMLKSGLCNLGSHSITHPILRKLNDKNLIKEIIKSKEILDNEFNINIKHFAFPYGSLYACSSKSVNIAKTVYKMCFSTYNLKMPFKRINKYFIPRINVNEYNYNVLLR